VGGAHDGRLNGGAEGAAARFLFLRDGHLAMQQVKHAHELAAQQQAHQHTLDEQQQAADLAPEPEPEGEPA